MRSSVARKSLAVSLVNVYEAFAISWPTVVDAALQRVDEDVCDHRLASWAHKIVKHPAIDLEVRGKRNMEPGTTNVIMSNHQSFYDVPVLFNGGATKVVRDRMMADVRRAVESAL
jgi:1-acyl-sn-glycerol-3-phosphate acyltransferase